MICPVCLEQNLKSRVFPGMSSSTCMWCAPYYDEDGEYHHHDLNVTTTTFQCTNNHIWDEQTHFPCPAPDCSWNESTPRKITIHAE